VRDTIEAAPDKKEAMAREGKKEVLAEVTNPGGEEALGVAYNKKWGTKDQDPSLGELLPEIANQEDRVWAEDSKVTIKVTCKWVADKVLTDQAKMTDNKDRVEE